MLRLSLPLLRWLVMACAALALAGGEGLHEALHREDSASHAPAEAPSGQLEIHAGDCQHRQDVHEPHTHACLACKAGQGSGALLVAVSVLPAEQLPSGQLASDATHRAPRAFLPGTLGARGPPTQTV